MERLDEHYELMREYVPNLKPRLSEFVRPENFFISWNPTKRLCRTSSSGLVQPIASMHPTPHLDGRFHNTLKLTAGRSEFSGEVPRTILADNPASCNFPWRATVQSRPLLKPNLDCSYLGNL
jgi:hypothetical protein